MGLTNFHYPDQMFERAGRERDLQARIQDFGCPVYVNYTSFTQETIDQYSWRLLYNNLDKYASRNEVSTTVTSTPEPLKVPKLSVTPVFKSDFPASKDPLLSKVDYVLLVEGNRGGNQKMVIRHDLHNAGVTFFHEAMNGYSVVFAGAVLKSAFAVFMRDPGVGGQPIVFKKAESVEQFLSSQEAAITYTGYGMDPYEVLVLC